MLEIKTLHIVVRHVQRQQVIGIRKVYIAQFIVCGIEMQHRQQRTQLKVICQISGVIYLVITDIQRMEQILVEVVALAFKVECCQVVVA